MTLECFPIKWTAQMESKAQNIFKANLKNDTFQLTRS